MKELHLKWNIDNSKSGTEYTGIVYWSYTEDKKIDKFYYFRGEFHRTDGPAIIKDIHGMENGPKPMFYLKSKRYYIEEQWFNDLSEDEKLKALFNVSEWRNKFI